MLLAQRQTVLVASDCSDHREACFCPAVGEQPWPQAGYDINIADTAAGVLIEPVQGEFGYYPANKAFMQGLAERCRQHGILLICDEIQAGYGRTGRFWSHSHFDVTPDIVITASDDQISELFRNIEKDNLERQRIYVDPPEREILQNRTDRMVERLERWIGTLTETQYDSVQQ